MKKISLIFLSAVLFFCAQLFLQSGHCQEWPQFRGPDGSGHASAKNLPIKWSENENVKWKCELPGRGWSSPVISGKYIWMTTAIETTADAEAKEAKTSGRRDAKQLNLAAHVTLRALCVDRETGKLMHDVKLFELTDPEPIHSLNSYASPTPVIAGERVFCHFGSNGTACLNLKTGEVIWKTNRFKYDSQNGAGASPVAWQNLLIFHCDGRDKQFIAAIDQQDGKTVWQVNRSGKLPENDDFKKAYCTPAIIEAGGNAQLISPASDWVYSYDPETGKENWRAAYGELGFSTVPKPIAGNGKVYVLTSYMKSRLLAVRHNGHDDVTDSHVEWTADANMPSKPSLLLIDHKVFAINDKGIASCLDSETGELLWRDRVEGNFSASPLYAAGHIYLFAQEGPAIVLQQKGDEFEQIGRNQLDGGFMASPAVAGQALFLRTDKALYRIENE